jgi:hydroxymethylbilane synthase
VKRTIRVGSRESELAILQAELVIDAVKNSEPDLEFELITMRTSGDRNLEQSLDTIGGKGLFIKELEQALYDQTIDIAVHSYKDMPWQENPDLPIVALSRRESPFDVLVLPEGIDELDTSLPVGSSSQRRSVQLRQLYTEIEVKPIRGNINTRLAKLDLREYSALVLAHAGLIRLGLADRVWRIFGASEMVPSASQGILAVQSRLQENCSYLSVFHSWESEIVSLAERQFLKTLGSDCTAPVGVYAFFQADQIYLTGMYTDSDTSIEIAQINGQAARAQWLGEALAQELLDRVGRK